MLLLSPTGPRGWFGGSAIRAQAARHFVREATLAEAGEALEAAFDGRDPALVAVLLTYEGVATIVRFESWEEGVSDPVMDARVEPHRALVSDSASAVTAHAYRAGVRAVRDSVVAGDVYVLNLTYQVTGRIALSSADATFAALRERAGAEMSAFLEMPGLAVASVSPERFLRVVDDPGTGVREVEVWPIKGTRPRGADPAADRAFCAELLASEKERSEHVMVVDMERNDLGRVCEPGSVRVEPLFEVVTTPYCHQMVSRVAGTLRAEATIPDLLAAAFPCGSVTGAPKVAAMRIAAELEGMPRGAYTGALLVAREGEIDSSVLIRTAVIEEGRLAWGTGAGVTSDSDPAGEWLETLLKASPLLGDPAPPVALRETCRVASDGSVPLLDYHLARLTAGGCGRSVLARVRAQVAATLASRDSNREQRLAVSVAPDGGVTCESSDRASSLAVVGLPVAVPVPVAAVPALPPGASKPADRSAWDAAQAQAGSDAQAVLVTADGTLIDGANASVWLRRGSELLTPPAPPAVAGVAREVVFDLAVKCGFTAAEAHLTTCDLAAADEVFFTNAYAGVVAARGRGGEAAGLLGKGWPW